MTSSQAQISEYDNLKENSEKLIKITNFNESTVEFLDYYIINHSANPKKYEYNPQFNYTSLNNASINNKSSSVNSLMLILANLKKHTCSFIYDDISQYFFRFRKLTV